MATGQAGTFGESGERFSTTVEDTPADSRELLARVDFAPGTNAGMESMLGFRQDLGIAGSVQSVAAITIEPEVEGAGDQGLDEAAVRSFGDHALGDAIRGRSGFDRGGRAAWRTLPSTVTAMLPFANVEWRRGASTFHYRMATMAQARNRTRDEAERRLVAAQSRARAAPGDRARRASGDRLGAGDRRLGRGRCWFTPTA